MILSSHILHEQAFELCCVRGWNQSYESLTSFAAREKLRNLKTEDPLFWNELQVNTDTTLPGPTDIVPEDEPVEDDDFGDDSSVGLSDVIKTVVEETIPSTMRANEGGGLVAIRNADDENEEPVDGVYDGGVKQEDDPTHVVEEAQATTNITVTGAELEKIAESSRERGRGKRKRTANKLYNLHNFMQHHDDEPSDIDE